MFEVHRIFLLNPVTPEWCIGHIITEPAFCSLGWLVHFYIHHGGEFLWFRYGGWSSTLLSGSTGTQLRTYITGIGVRLHEGKSAFSVWEACSNFYSKWEDLRRCSTQRYPAK